MENSRDNQAKTFETWHGPTGHGTCQLTPCCITLVAREGGEVLWGTRGVDDEG